ncbi:Transcriptional regulator, AcrR family, partial [hydrothermal vent metagenome]
MIMARPREFDPNKVLQIAIELFWMKGYFDSSVDEVVRRSGVAKYGIYGTFGSKRGLFIKALNQYASDRHRDIQSPIRKPDASLPEIQQFFKRAVKIMTQDEARRGCMIVNTGVELGFIDAEIRDFVANFF